MIRQLTRMCRDRLYLSIAIYVYISIDIIYIYTAMPLVLSPILRPAYNGVYLSLASIDIQNTHLLYMCLFTDKGGP